MEIIAFIVLLLWVDPLTFDVTHDTGQPLIGHAAQAFCEAGGGTYAKWDDPSVSCQGFTRPDNG